MVAGKGLRGKREEGEEGEEQKLKAETLKSEMLTREIGIQQSLYRRILANTALTERA
jgi:hypothetical protein